ncbi:hypothetical protein BJF78_28270 [Pseudonocardia sp. CNS-139]|nr:hypothetical protein BJF78_28270 [Pseudonocardia sp. CNS-139]
MLVFALLAAWVITLCVLITSAPPPGAASAAELVDRAEAALNAGDPQALATLLGPPLDHDYATAYLDRLAEAEARDIAVTTGTEDVVTISGRTPDGPFTYGLVAFEENGRWFLVPLPPV